MMTHSPDILFTAEYIKNVLYFVTVRQGKVLKNNAETHYFSIDDELIYENYYSDFGPLNLGCVYKYCSLLNDKFKQYLNKQAIVHYTSIDPKKKTNSAFLLGCYGVLYLSLSPKDALKPLLVHGQSYRPFQDAVQGDSSYTISIMDCLQALVKARALGLFNFQDFNYEEYDRLDKIQGGDLNWIVPGKFLAFIGPVDYTMSLYHPPEMYIDYFLENNVKIVIRLNKAFYDGNVFNKVGIAHYDLYFPDGSCPPRHILFKFLQMSESADCAIAVHCKAGLGRTGSLIGCYLIKHYRMTSHEAIGWMRICRPGSVIGHQQVAVNKTIEKNTYDWRVKTQNVICNQKVYNKGDQMETNLSRRSSAAGEPRVAHQCSTIKQKNSAKSFNSNSTLSVKNIGGYKPMASFRTTQGPTIRNVNDARNFILRSSYNGEQEKHLKSTLIVTPNCTVRSPNYMSTTPGFMKSAALNTGSKCPTQRRRLGRSPSPQRSEQTRATNTPTAEKFFVKDVSKKNLRDAFSKLKLANPRAESIGAASVGASSLGARRDAPIQKRTTTVRSDERPIATQGDLLNSIKFQRRYQETLRPKKLNNSSRDEISESSNKPNIKIIHSRISNGSMLGHPEYCVPREKPRENTVTRKVLAPPRPPSPTRRRNLQTSSFY